ncbi:MAG: hypothetical protein H0V79_03025 [Actinobacteria bacterium]|nr:hypothetical protein [Actinomycetota bacterium]
MCAISSSGIYRGIFTKIVVLTLGAAAFPGSFAPVDWCVVAIVLLAFDWHFWRISGAVAPVRFEGGSWRKVVNVRREHLRGSQLNVRDQPDGYRVELIERSA